MSRTLWLALLILAILGPQIPGWLSGGEDSAFAISVPADYPSIQAAINNAYPGDTVLVSAGLYYEHVVVNKTIMLVGEGKETIVDGSNAGTVIQVTADNVTVTGFTLQNTGWKWGWAGVEIYGADYCVVEDNSVYLTCHQIRLVESHGSRILSNVVSAPRDPFPRSAYGIRLENCADCLVMNNNVSDNIGGIHFEGATNCVAMGNRVFQNSQGIRLYSPCVDNTITDNTALNNTNDGMLVALPTNTTFARNTWFHNNFINNSQSFIGDIYGCLWDNGQEGNFWSNYAGTDANGDGIGDTPHVIDASNQDRYPLMHRWSPLPVHNVNTGLGYAAIQEAVDAPQTLAGHLLVVDPGTYVEHLAVHKSLRILGGGAETTTIDGAGTGAIVHITASNVAISGFTVRNAGNNSIDISGPGLGIFVDYCQNVTITENVVTACRYGIFLFHSAHNTLVDNVVSWNYEDGIWLYYSGSNVLKGNRLSDNKYNFGVFGQGFAEFNNTIDTSNVIDAKPVQYQVDVSDRVIDSRTQASTLYLINAHNVTVRDLRLSGNGNGVFLWNATESTVENLTVSGCNYGIVLQESDGNTVRESRCPENWVGIFLESSDYNSVKGNVATANEKGISLYSSSHNSLDGNTVTENLYGVRLFASGSNQLWHNNVIANTYQVDLVSSYGNSFDDGMEGNYWSGYTGIDLDYDGIGDTEYVIAPDNIDHRPLVGLFQSFKAVLGYSVDVVSNSTVESFEYSELRSMIRIYVSNMTTDQMFGFCRVRIPHALMNETYHVTIDGADPRSWNDSLFDDGSSRWIYVSYQHSTLEIIIVPEWQSASVLPLYVAATLLAAFAVHKRRHLWT